MAVVQSTYSNRMPVAVAGLIADMRNYDGISRNCETAAGIGFGLAVGRGDNNPATGAKLGGALDDFLGASHRDVTLDISQTNSTVDKYFQNIEMGILTQGTMWVEVTGSPGPDDPVHYNATTGVFASSGGSGPVLGARWMTNPVTAFGKTLCKVHFGSYNQAG